MIMIRDLLTKFSISVNRLLARKIQIVLSLPKIGSGSRRIHHIESGGYWIACEVLTERKMIDRWTLKERNRIRKMIDESDSAGPGPPTLNIAYSS